MLHKPAASWGDGDDGAAAPPRGDPREIAGAVAGGLLVRPRRGTFLLAERPPEVHLAAEHGGPVCCASAARLHGLWVLDRSPAVHVWLGPNGRAHRHPLAAGTKQAGPCGCVVHRDRMPSPRGAVVGVVDALSQMLGCCGPDAFFRGPRIGAAPPPARPSRSREAPRTGPRSASWLVDFARTDADSGLESLLRLRLHRVGISMTFPVRIGGVGVVDFVIGDRLIVEADGSTHAGEGRHRDLVRDAVAVSLGFVTLCFDDALIVRDWPLVERAVTRAVELGLHRTTAGSLRTAVR